QSSGSYATSAHGLLRSPHCWCNAAHIFKKQAAHTRPPCIECFAFGSVDALQLLALMKQTPHTRPPRIECFAFGSVARCCSLFL
ncbi:MAG TPA: hypothetical protein PK805_09795, partial [Acidovorax temperans]|nr:hypothetical protein [Acidovorax temperans]